MRRLRARRWRALGGALAVALAVGLLVAVSVLGARARDASARGRVGELPARERIVQVATRVQPLTAPGATIAGGERALAGLGVGRPVTVLVGGPVSPGDERGTRVVMAPDSRIVAGRAPRACDPRRCEVLTLSVRPALGERVRLGRLRARVVGRARLAAHLTPPERVLHGRAVLVGDAPAFRRATTGAALWVVTSATLRPGTTDLAELASRMRATEARLERAEPGLDVVTPAERLEAIDRRGRTAQRRLLLVGAQGAALFLAFAVLLGVARRPEVEVLETQLRSLGAARWQTALVRLVEVGVPALAGAAVALIAAAVFAVPAETFALVAALVAGAIAAEFLAARGGSSRALELAALVCLAAIAWQALATGGLDASQVSSDDAAPVLLLVPGLALFAGGVLVARLLPYGFRLAERAARRRSVPARLALLSLTRGGGLAAAATTFLALALGGGLFALDYRATLRGQLDAQAAFAAGTSWRVSAPEGVAPLTDLGGLTLEPPRPAIRLPALVSAGARYEDAREATLLALDGPVPATQGWTPPAAELRAVAPPSGPELDATHLSLWVRSSIAATIAVELLLPGDAFARLELGDAVAQRWVRLRTRVPPRLRGSTIVGLAMTSLLIPRPAVLDLGRLEPVDDLHGWQVTAGRFGDAGRVVPTTYERGPVPRGVIVDVPESDAPLIRPGYEVPEELPAVASEALAAIAVDRRLTAMVRGRPVPIRIAATSERLPTVTRRPDRFLLVDYDTLLAFLTAQRPGEVVPTEAWFGGPPRDLTRYADATIVSRAALTAAARRDALAGGADTTLLVTAVLAGVLAAAGLLLAAASLLRAERSELAGWRALGAGPSALARMKRLRVLALYGAGTLAAIAGAAIALRLLVALVAVTAGGGDPLPPIVLRIDWAASAALIAATGAVAVAIARVSR